MYPPTFEKLFLIQGNSHLLSNREAPAAAAFESFRAFPSLKRRRKTHPGDEGGYLQV